MIKQNLVEQHIIKKRDPRWEAIDEASFKAKNLYNKALYELRQRFFETSVDELGQEKRYFKLKEQLHWSELAGSAKYWDEFLELPAKVSQLIVKRAYLNLKGFIEAHNDWRNHPEKYLGRPKLPSYKSKETGRFALFYNYQAIGKRKLGEGIIVPSQLGIELKTKQADYKIVEVRVIPRILGHYVVEVVYEVWYEEKNEAVDSRLIAGIDLGVNNLMAVTSNKNGFKPFTINGRPLKAINQRYNKQLAKLRQGLSCWSDEHGLEVELRRSRQIHQLTHKRNLRLKHQLHVASKIVVERLVDEGIGILVIGKNEGWKQKSAIGKRNNQNFVQIPHARLIDMIRYKAKMKGIEVRAIEESYTSKCSFFDGEYPEKRPVYAGRRLQRGLFQTSGGFTFNADINASYNIIVKAFPNAFNHTTIAKVYPEVINPF